MPRRAAAEGAPSASSDPWRCDVTTVRSYQLLADEQIRRAGFAGRRRLSPLQLAEALLGHGSVRTWNEQVDGEVSFNGAICRGVDGSWAVYLQASLSAPLKNLVLCHELSHYLLGQGASEQQCDQLAAELLRRCWGRSSKRYRVARAEASVRHG